MTGLVGHLLVLANRGTCYGHKRRLSGYVRQAARRAVALGTRLMAERPGTAFRRLTLCANPAYAFSLQIADKAYVAGVPSGVCYCGLTPGVGGMRLSL
jgi:hypothetical protein